MIDTHQILVTWYDSGRLENEVTLSVSHQRCYPVMDNFPITSLRFELKETFLTEAYFALRCLPSGFALLSSSISHWQKQTLPWTICTLSRSPGENPVVVSSTSSMDFLPCLFPGSARCILGLGTTL